MRSMITTFFIALCSINTPAKDCFDDKNLSEALTSGKNGTLIYVWSPRMVYSVQNAALASRAAAAAGLEFVVLHDMRVPAPELREFRLWEHRASQQGANRMLDIDISAQDLATPPFISPLTGSLPLCAEQLLERNALRHFPTAFVIHQGAIHPHPVVGAMPWNAWVSSLSQRLKAP